MLHQILLKEEWVVGTHCAGTAWMGGTRIHLVTQHHDDDAKHPGGWGIWLTLLCGDFLNDVPELPRHLRLEDVKGLIRMQLATALLVVEEAVVSSGSTVGYLNGKQMRPTQLGIPHCTRCLEDMP